MTGNRRLVLTGTVLGLGIGWGSTQSLGKMAVSSGHGHFGLIFWQLLIGALVLALVQLIRRKGLPLTRATLSFGLIIAVIGTLIPNAAFYLAVAHLPAGVMSLLISTVPLIAFPIAMALGSERFSAIRLVGLLCGLTGVALIALPQAALPGAAALAWLPVALIGPLFYAVEGNVVARWGTAGLDPIQAMLIAAAVGTILALPLAIGTGKFIDPFQPWGQAEWALIWLSVINIFMYAGYVWLAGTAGAVFATQTSYVVTAAGMVWAMLLLGERFSTIVWFAGGIMLLGMALVQPRGRRPVST